MSFSNKTINELESLRKHIPTKKERNEYYDSVLPDCHKYHKQIQDNEIYNLKLDNAIMTLKLKETNEQVAKLNNVIKKLTPLLEGLVDTVTQ